LKIPITKKRAGEVAEGVAPEFKPQYHKKKRKKVIVIQVINCRLSLCVYPLKRFKPDSLFADFLF
jgi:hypothetical protein